MRSWRRGAISPTSVALASIGPAPARSTSDDTWTCGDQHALRNLVPENRVRAYEVRTVIDALADTGSVLELRAGFGVGMVTALARVEGRPLGIVANNPHHLGGAIDAPAADKAARFLQLCDAHDLPVLFLCDTPGFMVGPEAEETALVRHVSRLFVTGASLTVPFGTIVLRKGYGLGAQAMAGGSFKAPLFMVAWPTGEFGGMGLEGAVKLGFRRELDVVTDPDERQALFDDLVAPRLRAGQSPHQLDLLRDRRRDRSGRQQAVDHRCVRVRAGTADPLGQEATVHRHVVRWSGPCS